jgi:hypothetical protein
MAFRASRHDAQAARRQNLGESDGVLRHLALIGLERRRHRFLEGDRLAGDDVHQGPALQAGKRGGIDRLLESGAHQDPHICW